MFNIKHLSSLPVFFLCTRFNDKFQWWSTSYWTKYSSHLHLDKTHSVLPGEYLPTYHRAHGYWSWFIFFRDEYYVVSTNCSCSCDVTQTCTQDWNGFGLLLVAGDNRYLRRKNGEEDTFLVNHGRTLWRPSKRLKDDALSKAESQRCTALLFFSQWYSLRSMEYTLFVCRAEQVLAQLFS